MVKILELRDSQSAWSSPNDSRPSGRTAKRGSRIGIAGQAINQISLATWAGGLHKLIPQLKKPPNVVAQFPQRRSLLISARHERS
jgi:hypothetical protein